MARIAIDAHAIGGRLTGNETYIANLIGGIADVGTEHEILLLFTDPGRVEEWRQQDQGMEAELVKPANPLIRIPVALPLLLRRRHVDLLHVQYVGPPWFSPPTVTVIHDISFETHPEFFSKRETFQFKLTFPMTAGRARRVLTISEHSKRDLVEVYGLPDDKVVVTYLAAGKEFSPPKTDDEVSRVCTKYGVKRGYVLAVGNLQPRKNIERLINAYARLRDARDDIDAQLVVVGKKSWRHTPVFAAASATRWSDDIILTDYVSKEDLPLLYAGASLFAYPSLYEGFGLPPLEAMACGTPVIASNRASIPEVVGGAGILFDPLDVEDIAVSMATVLLEPSVAMKYSRAGLKQAGRFSWTECARRTLDVYEDVLAEERH